ncbi:DNAJ protein JJJ1 homolog [Zingiber officinale]|uniref:DNAJ protein JJJ1 homolog n=1 Tax=Zingiber officinale TaxID=94328 RepID=UPI001C4D45E7|nr:DNAJ protein JJJ1 homolog [Zingiber officinale]
MATEPQKRCLYEVLGVHRDCSQEEIRSAYRRLALQLHPDKVAATGAADAASATAAFQQLLHAYEVLSDTKERAWYDSHRSQILFSDSSSSKGHKPSAFFDLDLFTFFSSSVFSGYSDSGKGFYKVYGDLFAKVYEQEIWFAKQMDLGADAVAPSPLIGNLDSPYSQVSAFYNYWLGFSTVMDFGWVDEYDSSLGPNRRSRRAMEEENKKLRKKARREYIDTVRGLAAFSKKRDKRVVDMVVKKNLEEEKRRAEEKAKKKEEERKKMERTKLYQEPEWAKINEEEYEFDGFEDENDKKEKGGQEFYCVVCNKKFKSDKQWKNHEQSKKHKDKVAELRMTFEEDEEFVEEKLDDGAHVSFDYVPQESEESDDFEEVSEKFADALELSEDDEDGGHQEDAALQENDNEEEHAEETDDEASILEAMVTGRRKNDNFNHYDSLLNNNPNNVEQSSMEFGSQKRGRKNHTSGKENSEEDPEVKERDEISREETEVQNQESSPFLNVESASQSFKVKSAVSKKNISTAKNQKSKKQQADGKGVGKKISPADSNNLLRGKKQKANSKAPSNECETCGETFATRNKLFAHLGDTGHASLKHR